jgi:hypothetical protein
MTSFRLFIITSFFFSTLTAQAQAPQRMSFQAVVRDAGGKLVAERNVRMRLSILRGSPNGPAAFVETHQPQTNANGLASLEIGAGTPLSGTLAAIDWALGPYFLKTETDPDGGTSFGIVGVSQLLSVPYALHAKTAENGDQVVTLDGSGSVTVSGEYPNFYIHGTGAGYNAGAGIAINGTTISNTAPGIPVNLSGSGATTVSGTYPNFTISSTDNNTTYNAGAGIAISGTTISNTAPGIPVNLSGTGATTVSGAYPNFTISSTDNNTTYNAGAGIAISGTTITNTAPDQPITLTGAGTATVSGTYPDFTITSTGGTVNYSGGAGIDVTGTTITNTAPDQPITLTGAGTATVSGTYPNFTITSTGGTVNYSGGAGIDVTGTTITNTAPDQPVTLTGSGATTVSGTYPNFTINSTDANTTYDAGTGIAITGTTITNTAPDQPINLNGGTGISVTGTYPNFTVALAPPTTHYVGEMFGGGIVFYVFDNGQHGLIASPADLGTVSPWHTSPSSNTSATSYYDGSSNTSNIVAVQGSGAYAAKLCDDYSAGGFSDWYLPSLWELNLLFQNGFMVSFKLANDSNPGTTPLTATGSYWSSTQFDPTLSYMVYFPDGTPYLDFKDKLYRVRAVRRF